MTHYRSEYREKRERKIRKQLRGRLRSAFQSGYPQTFFLTTPDFKDFATAFVVSSKDKFFVVGVLYVDNKSYLVGGCAFEKSDVHNLRQYCLRFLKDACSANAGIIGEKEMITVSEAASRWQ